MQNGGKLYSSEPIGKLWTHIKIKHSQLGFEQNRGAHESPIEYETKRINVWFPKQTEKWGHAQNRTNPANQKSNGEKEGGGKGEEGGSSGIRQNWPIPDWTTCGMKAEGVSKRPHTSEEASLSESEWKFSQSKTLTSSEDESRHT